MPILPLLVVEAPEISLIIPPDKDELEVIPAEKYKSPPRPLPPEPTVIVSEPPIPVGPRLVPIWIEPELPLELAPVLKEMLPLVRRESAVNSKRSPEEDFEL
jgi:hypothetical protein